MSLYRYFGDYGLLLLREGTVSILSFLTSLVLVRGFSVEVYGQWAAIITLTGLYEVVVRYPIEMLGIYYVSSKGVDQRKYTGFLILIQTTISIIVLFIVFLLLQIPYIYDKLSLRFPMDLIMLILIFSPLRFIYQSLVGLYLNLGKFKFFGIISVTFSIFYLLAITIGLLISNESITYPLILGLCVNVIFASAFLIFLIYRKEIKLGLINDTLKNLKKGFGLYQSKVFYTIVVGLPVLGLTALGEAELAASAALANVLLVAFERLTNGVLVPVLIVKSSKEDDWGIGYLCKSLRLGFAIVLMLHVIIVLFSEIFINIVFGTEYSKTVEYLRIVGVFYLIAIMTCISHSNFIASGRVSYMWIPYLIGIVASIFAFVCYYIFGWVGFLLGLTLVYFSEALCRLLLLARLEKLSMIRFVPTQREFYIIFNSIKSFCASCLKKL